MCQAEALSREVDLTFSVGQLPTDASCPPLKVLQGLHIDKIRVQVSGSIHSWNTDASDGCKTKKPLSVSWKPLLDAINSSPSSPSSLSISSVFDCVGTHALKMSDLIEVLEKNPQIQDLQLDSIGFWLGDEDHTNTTIFDQLQQVVSVHPRLQSISWSNMHFCQQRRSDAWLFYSRMTTALARCRSLTTFRLSSPTRYYSRPILTLSALQTLWSHPSLNSLHLGHFNLWGSGSAVHCSASLRDNSSLVNLSFTACVFAAANDPAARDRSLLVGLDENTCVQNLNLTECMLYLESAGLVQALAVNQTVQSLCLDSSRLGFDEVSHDGNLCRILCALRDHTKLSQLSLHSMGLDSRESHFDRTKAFLHAVRDLVECSTRILCVDLDANTTDDYLRSVVTAIRLRTGLNRVGYWELCPARSSPMQWMEAISLAGHEEHDTAVATLYHMVRVNPAVCSGGGSRTNYR